MPERHPFEYAVVRVVPRVDREEFVNAGVVLFSRAAGFLGCRIELDAARVRALAGAQADAAALDLDALGAHLRAMSDVCAGNAAAGPIAQLSPSERFHWLVSPRSAAIQLSPVHGGVSDDPRASLARLYATLVAA